MMICTGVGKLLYLSEKATDKVLAGKTRFLQGKWLSASTSINGAELYSSGGGNDNFTVEKTKIEDSTDGLKVTDREELN